jgi:large subunit ribosomal protein L7/L12
MGTKTQEQIARLRAEAEKAAERAKKKAAEAAALERKLKSREAAEERKRDTRRKILAGSMQLELASRDEEVKRRMLIALDKYLTRDDDRSLFGLGPLRASVQ